MVRSCSFGSLISFVDAVGKEIWSILRFRGKVLHLMDLWTGELMDIRRSCGLGFAYLVDSRDTGNSI